VEEMLGNGMVLVGSPDTVSRQMERMLADGPVRWLFAWTYNGLVPHEKLMRSLELFATKVAPRFGGLAE
jgi:alkanesulfonate monooxygenase SsuD/methylene tetrahydromethanopterin reductase-like flavin-dependent oxidoreductase (luciferase family)